MAVMSGKVEAVSISTVKGTPKRNVPSAILVESFGMLGDAHAGSEHRQVSLLAIESIDKMRKLGADVSPGAFAENITVSGVDLLSVLVGDIIHIGSAELTVTQLGKECHNRCAIFEAVGDCVMPREGVFASVGKGGAIRRGDDVTIVSCKAVGTSHDPSHSS